MLSVFLFEICFHIDKASEKKRNICESLMFSNGFRGIIDSSIPKLEARYCCDNLYSIFHFISDALTL